MLCFDIPIDAVAFFAFLSLLFFLASLSLLFFLCFSIFSFAFLFSFSHIASCDLSSLSSLISHRQLHHIPAFPRQGTPGPSFFTHTHKESEQSLSRQNETFSKTSPPRFGPLFKAFQDQKSEHLVHRLSLSENHKGSCGGMVRFNKCAYIFFFSLLSFLLLLLLWCDMLGVQDDCSPAQFGSSEMMVRQSWKHGVDDKMISALLRSDHYKIITLTSL